MGSEYILSNWVQNNYSKPHNAALAVTDIRVLFQ